MHLPGNFCLVQWCRLLEIALWNTGLQVGTKRLTSLFQTRGLVEIDLHNICYWLRMPENDVLHTFQWADFNAMENDTECWGKNKYWASTHIWLWLEKSTSNWSISFFSGIGYLWWVTVLLQLFCYIANSENIFIFATQCTCKIRLWLVFQHPQTPLSRYCKEHFKANLK